MNALPPMLHRSLLKIPFSQNDVQSIRQELNAILTSNHFRNSRRYPAFLTHIVETALEGKSEGIKERSIGVEAFGRPADYDTNLDPIVRNTASEVRKRLTLYYAEQLPYRQTGIEISLQSGSYVPEFFFLDANVPADGEAGQGNRADESALTGAAKPGSSAEAAADTYPAFAAGHPDERKKRRKILFRAGMVFLSATLVAAIGWYWWSASHPQQEFWTDFCATRNEVLIVVPEAPSPGNTPESWVRDNPDIALEDLTAILAPSSVLAEHHIPYNVKLEPQVNLADMTNRPVILIGGPTNKWAIMLTAPLRYRMSEAGGLYVIDSQQTSLAPLCAYQLNQAKESVINDCAIVARFHSSLTGSIVVAIAGAGRNGTQAAGEWITSPGLDGKLSELFQSDWKEKNIEIVLKTTVIDGKSSAPTVVRSYSW